MHVSTWVSLARSGRLRTLGAAARVATPFYRATWLATAGGEGVLSALRAGPRPVEALADALDIGPDGHEALAAWLQVGVDLGDLSRDGRGYALGSLLARRLAEPEHDAVLAILEEAVDLHGRLLRETPDRLRRDRPFTLADQDGALIARSSRIVEPFIHDAVADLVPATGPVSLLEIGCGSGTHLRKAASVNPALTALGLELQPEVAELARANLAAWGLTDRIAVETGDVRDRTPEPRWDLATLHQNVYYFPVDARVALLRHVLGFLKPGGRLLLTTGCRGGSAVMGVLDLWGAATEGAGRLPEPDELVGQLEEAGYLGVRRRRLVPGEALFAFVGEAPR